MVLALRERGFARELLEWRWSGATLLTAEISAARYVIRCDWHEALAHAEIRDVGGSRRVEVGSFPSVGEARAACDRHAAGLCVREEAAVPVEVRIAKVRKPARVAKPERPRPALSERERRAFDHAMASLSAVLGEE